MKSNYSPWIAVLMLLMGSTLAGCIDNQALLPSKIEEETNDRRGIDYNWPGPIFTNSYGIESSEPAWYGPERHPAYVQQYVPRVGVLPQLAVTNENSLVVTTNDQVQRSTDGGKSWDVVLEFDHPVLDDRFSGDGAVLTTNTDGNQMWLQYLSDGDAITDVEPSCQEFYTSVDDGVNWSRITSQSWPVACGYAYESPKKMLTSPSGPQATGPELGNEYLYMCSSNAGVGLKCDVSIDGGQTFRPKPIIFDDPECSISGPARYFQFGTPAVHPDGTVIIAIYQSSGSLEDNIPPLPISEVSIISKKNPADQPDCPNRPMVVISEDNGMSWQIQTFPGNVSQLELDPGLTISPDGTAFLAFRDENHTVKILRSKDKFESWEGPFQVSPQAHTLNTHVAISSGDSDRVTVMYYGTQTEQEPGIGPSQADPNTIWHLYSSVSFDANDENPYFVTQQVTPREGPIQMGCIEQPAPPPPWEGECANLGTSIDIAIGSDGRMYGVFVDGCTHKNGCVGDLHGAWQGRESQVAVAVQDSGESFYQDQGLLEALQLEYPTPEENKIDDSD